MPKSKKITYFIAGSLLLLTMLTALFLLGVLPSQQGISQFLKTHKINKEQQLQHQQKQPLPPLNLSKKLNNPHQIIQNEQNPKPNNNIDNNNPSQASSSSPLQKKAKSHNKQSSSTSSSDSQQSKTSSDKFQTVNWPCTSNMMSQYSCHTYYKKSTDEAGLNSLQLFQEFESEIPLHEFLDFGQCMQQKYSSLYWQCILTSAKQCISSKEFTRLDSTFPARFPDLLQSLEQEQCGCLITPDDVIHKEQLLTLMKSFYSLHQVSQWVDSQLFTDTSYWQCFRQAVKKTKDNLRFKDGQFQCLNDKGQRCMPFLRQRTEDVMAFSDFVKKADEEFSGSPQKLREYFDQETFDKSQPKMYESEFWTCWAQPEKGVFDQCFLPLPKAFPPRFQCLNKQFERNQCFALKTEAQSQADDRFRQYFQEDSLENNKQQTTKFTYNDFKSYIKNQGLTGQYWQCVNDIIDLCNLPELQPYTVESLKPINNFYDSNQCFYIISNDDYAAEKKLRAFANQGANYDQILQFMEINNLENKNDYWQCSMRSIDQVLLFKLTPFPPYFDCLNQQYSKMKCFNSIQRDDYYQDQQLRKFALGKDFKYDQLRDYLLINQLLNKDDYWTCFNNVFSTCYFTVPEDIVTKNNDFSCFNKEYKSEKCFDQMLQKDVENDKQFRKSALLYKDYKDLKSLLEIQKVEQTDGYWICVESVINHCKIPKPDLFTGKFAQINDQYDQQNCHKLITYEDWVIEVQFRAFANKQDNIDSIRKYLESKNLEKKNQYWVCVINSIDYFYPPYVPNPFIDKFECLNKQFSQQKCLEKIILPNVQEDKEFRQFASSDLTLDYKNLQQYLIQNKLYEKDNFWKCYKEVFNQCHPSQPEDIKTQNDDFKCFNQQYKSLNCYSMINYNDFQNEQIFRQKATLLKTYQDLRQLFIDQKLKNTDLYWTCVEDALNHCQQPAPTPFEAELAPINNFFTQNKCQDNTNFDDWQADQKLREKANKEKLKANQIRAYLLSNNLLDKDNYWVCFQKSLDQAFPPFTAAVLPANFDCLNKLYQDYHCPYFIEQDDIKQDELFRKYITSQPIQYTQMKQYLIDNKLQGKNPYWQCYEKVFRKPKDIITPNNDFTCFNQQFSSLNCFDKLTLDDEKKDINFRTEAAKYNSYDQLRKYLADQNLKGSNSYWTCVEDAVNHCKQPLPTQFTGAMTPVNVNYNNNQCYNLITYQDWVAEKLFREYANQGANEYKLRIYMSENKLTSPYWQCVKKSIDQVFPEYIAKPLSKFPCFNTNYQQLNCISLITSQSDQQADEQLRLTAEKQFNYINELDEAIQQKVQQYKNVYWQCNQDAISKCTVKRPKDLSSPKDDFKCFNEQFNNNKCYTQITEQDLANDEKFRNQAQTLTVYSQFTQLLKDLKLTDSDQYWKCVQTTIDYCLPKVKPFTQTQLSCFNYLYEQLNCFAQINNIDNLAEQEFRTYGQSNPLIKYSDLKDYLINKKLYESDNYWKCIDIAINECNPPQNGDTYIFNPNIKQFSDQLYSQGCFSKIQQKDYQQDIKFREDAKKFTDLNQLRQYLTDQKLQGSDEYWLCVEDALNHIQIPKPVDFPASLQQINTFYSQNQCLKMYSYDDWQKEKLFREFAAKGVTADQLRQYLNDQRLTNKNAYWQCVQKSIEQAFPSYKPELLPSQFNCFNNEFGTNTCDKLIVYDDIVQDQQFRQQALKPGMDYKNLESFLITNNFFGRNKYWTCVEKSFYNCYIPFPQDILTPTDAFKCFNQQYQNQLCYKQISQQDKDNDLKFRQQAAQQSTYDQLRALLVKLNLKDTDNYWKCINDIFDYCSPLKPELFKNDLAKINSFYDSDNCFVLMQGDDFKIDKELRIFANDPMKKVTPDQLRQYLKDHTLLQKNMYWTCVQKCIDEAYVPKPQEWPNVLNCLNQQYTTKQCFNLITYKDYLQDQDLRKQSYQQSYDYQKLDSKLKELNILQQDDYWKCFKLVFDTCHPPKPADIYVANDAFNCINKNYNDLGCYLYMSPEDYPLDLKFREDAKKLSNLDQFRKLFESQKFVGTNQYWTCYQDVVDHCYPAKPIEFQDKLLTINAYYDQNTCYQLIKYEQSQEESKFRSFSNGKTPDQLRTYLIDNKLSNKNAYWICVEKSINQAFPPMPQDFPIAYQCLNIQYQNLKCYSKINYEDYQLETDFRKYTQSMTSINQVEQYLNQKGLSQKDDYWKCIVECYKICIQPEQPIPFQEPLFKQINVNYLTNNCYQKISDADSKIEKDFRLYANQQSPPKTADLLRSYIKSKGVNNAYWDCVILSINQYVPPKVNDFMNFLSDCNIIYDKNLCQSKITYNDWNLDNNFRNSVQDLKSWSQINTKFGQQKLNNEYWTCVQSVLTDCHPNPPKFKDQFSCFNDKLTAKQCNDVMRLSDFDIDKKFRDFVQTQTVVDYGVVFNQALMLQIFKNPSSNPYYQCMEQAISQCSTCSIQPGQTIAYSDFKQQNLKDAYASLMCQKDMTDQQKSYDCFIKQYEATTKDCLQIEKYLNDNTFLFPNRNVDLYLRCIGRFILACK